MDGCTAYRHVLKREVNVVYLSFFLFLSVSVCVCVPAHSLNHFARKISPVFGTLQALYCAETNEPPEI